MAKRKMKTTPEQAKAGYKLYKKRKASGFNDCVGKEMRGTKSTGRGDKKFQKKFVESLIACGANVSAKTKKKWKIK